MRGGGFLYNRKQIDENKNLSYEDVYNEIKAQIAKVEEYSNGKLKLDHLNTHHFLKDNPIICKAIHDIAKELNLPTRREEYAVGLKSPDMFYFDFTIENVSVQQIEKFVRQYKHTDKVIELVTHSGYVDEYTKSVTSYVGREKELNVLRQAKQQGLFEGIELISFSQI